MYFTLVGSASGSELTFMGTGGGCPSKGTLERSAIMDRRLFRTVGCGPEPIRVEILRRVLPHHCAESAGTSRDSGGKLGWDRSGPALL